MSNKTFDNPSPHESQNSKDPKSSAAGGRAESAGEPVGMLGEDYLIYKVIRGGMGEVYICEPVSERGEAKQARGGPESAPQKRPRVALKTFQKRLFFDRASRQAFLREVSIWARLTGQPHIMP
jgi:hypothetical protein